MHLPTLIELQQFISLCSDGSKDTMIARKIEEAIKLHPENNNIIECACQTIFKGNTLPLYFTHSTGCHRINKIYR